MNKRITAIICSMALAGTLYVPVTAAEPAQGSELLFSHDFTDAAELEAYTENAADSTSAPLSADNGYIEAQFSSGWSATNGIRTDITEYVRGADGIYSASVDFLTWDYYDNPAVLAFEIVGEDDTAKTVVLDSAIGTGGVFSTLTGSAELTVADTDTVYLTVTHYTGNQRYDNISLVRGEYEQEGTLKKEIQFFGNEIFAEGNFSIYDDTNTEGAIAEVWDNFGISAEMGNGWNEDNGVKTDITEYVSGYSGKEFGISVNVTSWAFTYDNEDGTQGVNKAKAFFKVVSKDGTETVTDICSGPASAEDITENEANISGSAVLSFEDTDTVYLCFTQGGGTQQYKEISFSVFDDAEPVPEGDKAEVLSVDFSDAEDADGFMAYDSSVSDEYEIYAAEGCLVSSFIDTGWNTHHGVKLDVTNLVQGNSGAFFGASAEVFSWYFGDTNAKLLLEAVSPSGEVKTTELGSGIAENGQYASISGEAAFSFDDEDTVYLCITHPSGTHRYDNIELYYYGTVNTTPLFTDDFGDETQAEQYSGYDSTVPYTKTVENGAVTMEYDNGEQSWGATNGIRREITADIAGLGGSRFYASMDFRSWYYGEAQLFFEVVDENGAVKTVQIASGAGENGDTITVSGSAELSFNEGDRIYLCATEVAGIHIYDNISLSYAAGIGNKPVKPQIIPDGATAFFLHDFASAQKAAQIALYSPYSEGTVSGADIQAMKLTDSDGIKTDISEYVKLGSSGDTFGAAMIMKTPGSDAAASMFIEVRDENGEVKNTYPLASSEGLARTDGTFCMGTGWLDAPLTGEAAVEFDAADKIYLCVTQPGALQYYDNIYFWGKVSAGSEGALTAYTPVLTENGAVAAVSNTTDKAQEVKIYTVSYNGTAISSVKVTDAAVEAGAIGKEIEIPGAAGDTVLVWDSNMKPLTEKTVLAQTQMTGTWSAAAMDVFQLREPDFSNKTIRQRVHISTGGDKLTLELSNEFGYGDLRINSVHIALPMEESVIKLDTDTPVTFGGSESVTIPKGGTVVSDLVYFNAEDMSDITVTMSVGTVPYNPTYNEWSTGLTGHEFSNSTTYLMENAPVNALS
ncbi:MAG: hypothetical protein ACI4DP_00835, partial [Candidatus Ornithomonoglobus sp.]